jgi:ABC-type amino acid transport substrate-binding protein
MTSEAGLSRGMSRRTPLGVVGAVVACLLLPAAGVQGGTLAQVRENREFHVCANPEALPYSSNDPGLPGFHVEVAEALARALGVRLRVSWVENRRQARTAGCDAFMEEILVEGQEGGGPVRPTRPYYRSGIALLVPDGAAEVSRFEDLRGGPVAVVSGSWSHRYVDKRGLPIRVFRFQEEIIGAVQRGEAVAGAVVAPYLSWYLKVHPQAGVHVPAGYAPDPELTWDVAVGLRNADGALVQAVNQALEGLIANQTLPGIFARYGVVYTPPPVR